MNNVMALSSRRWYSHGFEFSLRIPRSHSGNYIDANIAIRGDRQVSREAHHAILRGIGRWKPSGVKCCQSPQRGGLYAGRKNLRR